MKKIRKLHKHHTIGFDTVDKIDWHLKNLWNEGYKTIEMLTPKQHIKRHKELRKDKS